MPDIINLFLSGFVFITLFSWLNSKTYDVSIITIWSLIISYVIKIFYSFVHSIILSNVVTNPALKIIVYVLTAIVASFVTTKMLQTKALRKLLYKTNNKSVNDDIFDEIIDRNKPTMMQVYLKSSDVYYIGKFALREEKGLDSWIVLVDYCSANRKTNDSIYCPNDADIKSSVTINLNEIESIELIYEDDSEVWKNLNGENKEEQEN